MEERGVVEGQALAPPARPTPRAYLNLALRAALSLLLVGALVYHIGSGAIVGQMRLVPWYILAHVILVLASHVAFVTPRWASILRGLGHNLPSLSLLGSVFVGFLFNQLLPTAVGGDVIRAWRARHLGVPWEMSIHSVLFDRASGVIVAVLGLLILIPFTQAPESGSDTPKIGSLALVLGFGVLIGLAALVTLRYAPGVGPAVQRAVRGVKESVLNLARQPGLMLAITALAAAGQALLVIATWLLASAMRVELPLIDLTFVVLAATLASAIPISIAGWGIREGALVFLFGIYGVAPDTAIAISILLGACLAIAAAPAVLILLFGASLRPSSAAEP